MLEGGTIAAIEARGRDIQRELGATGPVFIGQEPPYVVVDVPRDQRAVVTFSDVEPALQMAQRSPGELPIVMGADAGGRVITADLAEMPHLLVAGTTGSGKSVFLTALGACLGLLPPSRLELVMIDIKGLDFTGFTELPHLRTGQVIEDPKEAVDILEHLMTEEITRRRDLFRATGSRQIIDYFNTAAETDWPPQIVVMIDEYAQLVALSGRSRNDLERLIQQYAQFARAFGIYLILATQRPSIDVITGRIKANLPARCVFRVPSFNDSRTVIDTGGAEQLLGAGDMLFYRDGALQRLQAPWTTDDDLIRVTDRQRT
jgi:DNA segregation ATPase FtsK/SpoIIIE-like protein